MSELSQIVVTDANGVRRHVNYALEGDGSLTRTTLLADGTEVALSSESLGAIVAAIQENNNQDLRGLASARPAANSVNTGVTYWAVDTGVVSVSDGTNWREV